MADDNAEGRDRRRVDALERDIRQLETHVAVMKATLDGLVSTMDSRHRAFERGQDLILERLENLQKTQQQQEKDLTTLANARIDLSKLTLSPGMLVTVVLTVCSIVAGLYGSTWGMRSDIRDINTHLSAQADTNKLTQKLEDERSIALRGVIDEIKRKTDLQQLEVQNLRETVLEKRTKP